MKYAFVHAMRTGGTYLVRKICESLDYDTNRIGCGWFHKCNRDLSRSELFSYARKNPPSIIPIKTITVMDYTFEPSFLIHAHIVAWDEEMVDWYQKHDWIVFTIVRNERDQLTSLYKFINDDSITLDEFITRQVNGEEFHQIDYHHWKLPTWISKIERIPYKYDYTEV